MKTIIVRSPTRVDLAGGTLDLWPLWAFLGGCKTVNVAIDIWTEVQLTPHQESSITITSDDFKFEKTYRNIVECLGDTEPRFLLIRTLLEFCHPRSGFALRMKSQSPVGGGLGGSSSLLVSLVQAFYQWENKRLDNYAMVELAHNIEARILMTPTGTQDYFPAISGGLNLLSYSHEGVAQQVLDVDMGELRKHFLLIDTGKAHHSGMNNWQVVKNVVEGNQETIAALRSIKEVSEKVASACRDQNWHVLPQLFQEEYAARIKLAPSFSSPEIERLHDIALRAGALGVKICGAGGGGCVLVWCEKDLKGKVIEACQKNGFQVLSANPVEPLVRA